MPPIIHCLELTHSLTHIAVTDATFKLRVSGGLRVHKYVGRGAYDPLIDQGSVAGVDKDTTMCFTLTHAGDIASLVVSPLIHD